MKKYDYLIVGSGLFGSTFANLANKADKLAPTKVEPTVLALQNELNPLKDLKFIPFSSEKRIYSEEVWKEIENRI